MKILWLSHLIPYPPKGGVLQRSYNMIKQLSYYHSVDLLAFNQKKLLGSFFNSIEEGIAESNKVLSKFCGKLQFFDIDSCSSSWGSYSLALKSLYSEPYNINWLKSEFFATQLDVWLNNGKYNIVVFDTISLVPYFSLLPADVATCLDHHNIESHMLLRRSKKEINFFKKLYFYQESLRLAQYERNFCPQFTLNITCSDIDSNRLAEISPSAKILTIPNGVDLDYFSPQGIPLTDNRLIFVGTMNWYPNIEAVLYIAKKLWPALKSKYPALHCDIIGANPPSHISELSKLLPDFHVHGFVDDVRAYIESATVYVCPIQDGGGTKLKILDAMAMSKAVVAHPIACEGINVTHALNVLLAGDNTAFVDQISLLIDSPDKRNVLGQNARKLIENSYNYCSIGKKLSETFHNCLV